MNIVEVRANGRAIGRGHGMADAQQIAAEHTRDYSVRTELYDLDDASDGGFVAYFLPAEGGAMTYHATPTAQARERAMWEAILGR